MAKKDKGSGDGRTPGVDKIQRLLNSFACGRLNGGRVGSGAMISPHIFLTSAHLGGPGWNGNVVFYRVNQFAFPPDDRAQRLSAAYPARAFPWQDFGNRSTVVRGDTVLWWVPDGPDGIAPGIKYGYLEVSDLPVALGAKAYAFWQNPAIRLDSTLLYSEGVAKEKGVDTDWLGQFTRYSTWSASGASGSSNIVVDGDHAHRTAGVTQGGPGSGGPTRIVADAEEFMREYDSDHNRVPDAVDYDWLITQPILDFHLFAVRPK